VLVPALGLVLDLSLRLVLHPSLGLVLLPPLASLLILLDRCCGRVGTRQWVRDDCGPAEKANYY